MLDVTGEKRVGEMFQIGVGSLTEELINDDGNSDKLKKMPNTHCKSRKMLQVLQCPISTSISALSCYITGHRDSGKQNWLEDKYSKKIETYD